MYKGSHLTSAMALVVFCPAPNFRAYIECPVTKSLETPSWHWLISFPMGALVYVDDGKCQFVFRDLTYMLTETSRLKMSEIYLCILNSTSTLYIH